MPVVSIRRCWRAARHRSSVAVGKLMIALQVSLNGKRVCIAGAEDLGVLSAVISAVGKLGSKTVPARPNEASDIFYSVGGRTSRSSCEDVHVDWQSIAPLKIGDTISVKVIQTHRADRPRSRYKAKPRSGGQTESRERRGRAAVPKRKAPA